MYSLRNSARLAALLMAGALATGLLVAENAPVVLPYEADFEASDSFEVGPVATDSVWNFDEALEVEILSFGAIGGQSLGFTGGQWLWLNSAGLADGEITWIDFYLIPAFAEADELPAAIESVQSAVTGFVKVDPNVGEIYAINGDGLGSGLWLPSGEQTALNGNVSQDWVRLTYRLDYTTKRWDLFVNGGMAMTDLGFLDNTVLKLTEFAARGDLDETSILDYFYAGGTNPLFADSSNDGLPDAWLTAQGLNILINQRYNDGDGDGLDNLTEFKLSTRADLADTDGDGADDGVELANGIDPTSMDTDSDGVQDGAELTLGLDPKDPDTDYDGAQDGSEITDGTDPLLFDTDGDGLADSLEPVWALDPLLADSDLAGLTETAAGSGIFEWVQDFGIGEGFIDGALSGQQSWMAIGDVQIAGEQVDVTDSITVDAAFGRLAGIGETRQLWISFRAKFIVGDLPDMTVNTEPAVAIWGAGNSNMISVWDEATQQWIQFETPTDITEWNEYALYFDYEQKEWLLTQNNQLIAADLPFIDEDLIVFSRFKALQGSVPEADPESDRNVASFDDFKFSNVEPEAMDFDGDGLVNSLERSLGSDLLAADTDGDGMHDLYEYQNGLNLLVNDAGLDGDGDGIANIDELHFGTNPQLADIDGSNGIVRRDSWSNLTSGYVSKLTNSFQFPSTPDKRLLLHSLDVPQAQGLGDNYGQRIYGLIIAPETADYTFWIAGDDGSELWLSIDDNPSHRERIAYTKSASNYQNWDRYTSQQSVSISLNAGEAYYFEILHKEASGKDYVSVAWQYNAQPLEIIGEAHLRASVPEPGDLDQDGLPDAWETANGLDGIKGYGVNGYAGDFDGDGIPNYREYALGTRADLVDTDGDGFSDLEELEWIHSDPLLADLEATPVVVETLEGSAYSSTRGVWATEGTELYSIDSTGSVGYALNFSAAGAYRVVVEIAEQNIYKSGSSTFEIRASVNDTSYGIRSATIPKGSTAELIYYLPYLSAGNYSFDLDWLNGFSDSFLRIKSVRVEKIDGTDADQNGIADWIENRATTFGSDAALPLEIYTSPFCFEGTSYAPAAVSIISHPVSDPANLRAESAQQALSNSYYADIELLPDEDRVVLVDDQSGLRTSQHTLTWAAFNAVIHDFHHIRLDDSMLITAIDSSLSQARPIELQLTAPDGTVETHSLAAEARLQALFDQAGDWQLQATLLPLTTEAPEIYDSVIRVSSASLSPAPIMLENNSRTWTPSVSDGEVVVESDAGFPLYEANPGTMPRSFEITSSIAGGRLLARLPNGPILSTTESKVIRDYTRTQTSNQIVQTFPDGTVMVSAYIILNEVPEDLSIDIHVFKSGVTFDDGTLWRTITAEDFDEQGRYQFFMLRAPDVNGGNCHRYWFKQDGITL